MKQLKCENCGATIKINDENKDFATCPYCKAEYQLNERKDIYIRMDDNTKEILTNGFKNVNKGAKYIVIPIMIFAIIIIIFVISMIIRNHKTINEPETNKNEEISNVINDVKNKMEKSSFNSQFEIRSGTKYKTSIEYLLDDVVTNNKTSKDMLITVIYKDTETTDPDKIIDIKHSLENKKYEVKLDYDENGYVNKITIENI